MRDKLDGKKIVVYLIIVLLIGLLLSYNAASSDSPKSRDDEEGETIALKEGDKFIESRSTVTYKLTNSEILSRINRMFGLRLEEEAILKFNNHLDKESLQKPIPKGTELRLFIQSKPGDK